MTNNCCRGTVGKHISCNISHLLT